MRTIFLSFVLFGFVSALIGFNASAQMHQDREGRSLNDAGGNLYGDSTQNWRADPEQNWRADPKQNWRGDANDDDE
jgi:hypothetical protein